VMKFVTPAAELAGDYWIKYNMVIRCIHDHPNDFKGNKELFDYLNKTIHLDPGHLSITKGKEYTVYSIAMNGAMFDGSFTHYLICDDDYPSIYYPTFYIADFFEVVEESPSQYWVSPNFLYNLFNKKSKGFLQTFKEFDSAGRYFERLIDGDNKAIKIFNKVKQLMDDEIKGKEVKWCCDTLKGYYNEGGLR